jgi:formate/nitrite transporter
MIKAKLKGKITWNSMFKNWTIVYISNFVWAIFVAYLVYESGLWSMSGNHLWATALKIANDKVNLDFTSAFIRWVLANWLVCLAIFIAVSSKDIVWKIFGILFPVMTFVACSFEHSIANMYFIPMWIMLKNQAVVVSTAWLDLTNLTWYNFFVSNLIPVTLWNIIWWSLFVWYLYYVVNKKD